MDFDDKLVNEAIEIFLNGMTNKFHIARGKLKKATISELTGVGLLQLAAELPKFPDEFTQPHASLVENAARFSSPKYYELIRKDHLKYNEDAWREIIRLLAQTGSDDAVETLREILVSAVGASELRIWQGLEDLLAEEKEFVGLPYLDWLVRMDGQDDVQAHHVRMVLIAHLEKGWLDEVTRKNLGAHLHTRLKFLLPSLAGNQRPTPGSWMFADGYVENRDELCEVIDLLGQLKLEAARDIIQQALAFADSRIKFFAMFALKELGEVLNTRDIKDIAAYPEMRGKLVERLQANHEWSLMPAMFASQLALAEADLVQWLTFPTELNSVPDEIKFLKKVETTEQPGQDMYYFRFRTEEPHWASEDGWMIGWSGPFPRQGLAQLGGTDTFSKFEKWDGVESASVMSKLKGLFKPK